MKILNVPTSLMECDGRLDTGDGINILIEVMASIAEEERLKNHQRQSEGIQAAKIGCCVWQTYCEKARKL